MSEHSLKEINKHVKVYLTVFVALLVLTGLTVGVARFHLPVHWAILVGLSIAFIKGFLVAGHFMHLVSEKKFIYFILILTVFFFLCLLFLPVLTASDHPHL